MITNFFLSLLNTLGPAGGGGGLPIMASTGICRWTGYGFLPLRRKQGILFRKSLSTGRCLYD